MKIKDHVWKVVFIGARHPHIFHRVEVLKKYSSVVVTGFYEDDEKTAEQFCARTGYARIPLLDNLEHIKPDITIIETMDDETPRYAMLAAPFSKALLLEKCAVPDYERAVELTAALQCYPVHVEHGYELHYLEIIKECKEILDSGALGQVTLAHYHGGCPLGCGAEVWQSNPKSMGGAFYTEGSHMIELMLYLMGMPEKVSGRILNLPKGECLMSDTVTRDMFSPAIPEEVQIGALYYEDVGAAIFEYKSCLATLDFTAWEATGWVKGWFMEFYGTNGTLMVRPYPSLIELELKSARHGYGQGIYRKEIPSVTQNGYTLMRNTYKTQFDRIFSILQSGAPADQSGMQTITNIAEICSILYKANSGG